MFDRDVRVRSDERRKMLELGDGSFTTFRARTASSLVQFLLGLVLFISAFGMFRLFIAGRRGSEEVPDWLSIHSELLGTDAILLAVLFLENVLAAETAETLPWSALVTPIAVGISAIATVLLKYAD